MRYLAYFSMVAALFAAGAYVWSVTHPRVQAADQVADGPVDDPPATGGPDQLRQASAVIVEIGAEKIHKEDIDWEYDLLLEGVFDKETMTQIPDLGARYHEEMQALRRSLVSNVIERKVLFAFLKQDPDFDASNPSRFSACLAEWQEAMTAGSRVVRIRDNKGRLKTRLCERSIIQQYVKERVFAAVKVDDGEIVEYYKNHASEYKLGERVVIRQILLVDEPAAKKIRNQATTANFESLARAHSIAPEAANGGKLGPFAKGGMPSVFDVAFHMKKGEISPILKSPYGYHVIMLIERLPGTQASLEEVHAAIATELRRKHEEDEYQKLVERALAAVRVSTPVPLW